MRPSLSRAVERSRGYSDRPALPSCSGQRGSDLAITPVGLALDPADRDLESGSSGKWEGIQLQTITLHPCLDPLAFQPACLLHTERQGQRVRDLQVSVVLQEGGAIDS